jgi:hypothetical protein
MFSRGLRVVVTAGMLAGVAACSSPGASCVGVRTEVPASVTPGETINLRVENLFSSVACLK